MNKIIFILLLLVAVLTISCIPRPHGEVAGKIIPAPPVPAAGNITPPAEEPLPSASTINAGCRSNDNCSQGKLCIDDSCQQLSELYSTDCPTKCHLVDATISTSDRETYTLKPGQGSYSYAGAIEWKVHSLPDYCPSDSLVIPIDVLKKNTGRVLSTQVITLQQDQTSSIITHPTIGRIAFTVKLDGINQECS